MSEMRLSSFLDELFERGRVRVGPHPELMDADRERAAEVLRERDRAARLELAHEPPALMIVPALWAPVVCSAK